MNFLFCVHPTREEAHRLHGELSGYLRLKGHSEVSDPALADFTLAIGGDGTVVAACRACSAPIIGINAGTLGYLTRVEPAQAKDALDRLCRGDYAIEERMMLCCGAAGGPVTCALNEAALTKEGSGVIRFTVTVDGIRLMRYTADGIICATPTGSTGYSLSAGGPIVDPASELMVLTPIAPHTLLNRPIVLSADSVVRLECENDAVISMDGASARLPAGTPFEIRRSPETMRFVSFGRESFIGRLQQKLG